MTDVKVIAAWLLLLLVLVAFDSPKSVGAWFHDLRSGFEGAAE